MTSNPSSRFQTYIVPALVLFVAFLTRLMYISDGPYHLDCLTLAMKASETLQTHHLQYLFGSGYPLVVLLGSFFVYLFERTGVNDPVFAVNFMSVVFGALGVWMFFLLIRRLISAFAALAGAFLFGVSPILWGTSVYGMSHSPSLFFLLVSLYFLFDYLQQPRMRSLVISAFFFGLMGAARLQDMVVMAVPMSYLFLSTSSGGIKFSDFPQRRTPLLQFLLITAAVTGLLHLPYALDRLQGDYEHQWKTYWYLGLSSNFRGLFSEFLQTSLIFLKINYTILGVALGLGGWLVMLLKQRRLAIFSIVWFLIFLFTWGNLSTIVPRFFVVMVPALIVGQCYALSMLFDGGRILRWIAIGSLVALLVMQAMVILPGLVYRHENSAVRDYSLWVGRVTEPNARIIGGDERFFISYYGKRQEAGRPSCAVGCSGEELENFRQEVDAWLKQGLPVYITNTALLADNPNGEFSSFIETHYQKLYIGEHFTEDWHQDGFKFRVGYEKLFRLYMKKP